MSRPRIDIMQVGAAIAVDWSGARDGGRRTWLAEVIGDELIELRGGWTSASLLGWLVDRAAVDRSLAVGLDFAFGFPSWFTRERFGNRPEFAWQRAAVEGDDWLGDSSAPFWGRPGVRRPLLEDGRAHFRATELALTGGHLRPKSIFQVGGAGSVGTGSIRGMPLLASLRSAGFSIWPFDPPSLPVVVEIYPRALTGRVVKSDPADRRRYLDALEWPLDIGLRGQVAATEDGFDAAVSARQMGLHAAEFADLPAPSEVERVEGLIWMPLDSRPTAR